NLEEESDCEEYEGYEAQGESISSERKNQRHEGRRESMKMWVKSIEVPCYSPSSCPPDNTQTQYKESHCNNMMVLYSSSDHFMITVKFSSNGKNLASASTDDFSKIPHSNHIVMTPKCKTANSTTLAIERRALPIEADADKTKVHVAGGDHRGIVINKEATKDNDNDVSPAQLSLEFRVFLVSAQTGKHTQESRTLQFWFTSSTSDTENATVAQEFFRELVSPQDFPRDYVGFIKKVMKLLQHGFKGIRKVEVTLTQLEESQVPPPTRPSVVSPTLSYFPRGPQTAKSNT
ncbi:hypothetical protein L9F63_025329, partial [Diploptera punctata]